MTELEELRHASMVLAQEITAHEVALHDSIVKRTNAIAKIAEHEDAIAMHKGVIARIDDSKLEKVVAAKRKDAYDVEQRLHAAAARHEMEMKKNLLVEKHEALIAAEEAAKAAQAKAAKERVALEKALKDLGV